MAGGQTFGPNRSGFCFDKTPPLAREDGTVTYILTRYDFTDEFLQVDAMFLQNFAAEDQRMNFLCLASFFHSLSNLSAIPT